jgi:formylglycine-generating enzyme required for sulfatase activity
MGKNWALVIGINKYNSLEHLKYAKADAEAMHSWLKEEGKFDRLFLFTENSPEIQTNLPERPILTHPTIGNLRTFFNQQFKNKLMKDVDNLWFFFSGHGRRGTEGDYLVLSDSDPEDTQTLLPVSYITERLRNWGAGNVVMFIDACRNLEDRPKGGRMITSGYQGMITFYSCQDGETSLEIQSRGRGAFTQVVLQALEAAKRENRCLTVAGLEGYLMEEVPKLSPNQHPLARVEPTYKSDFILFGEAGEEDIQRLKNLGIKKAFLENKEEEARQLLLHANIAAKGTDIEVINALTLLRGRESSQKSSIVIEPIRIDPQEQETRMDTPKTLTGEAERNINKKLKVETVFVNKKGERVSAENFEVDYYQELLGEGVESLKMISIPAGKFWMGSPKSEKERSEDESPQHLVTVPAFFMSQTQVTQAQWKAVSEAAPSAYASLPQEGKKLEPDPSRFKGDDLPVERVSWQDAIEFCARLSRHTGRNYRLPSEAEWEYACRAIQSPEQLPTRADQKPIYPPFHFGETITSDLANYNSSVTYQQEVAGEYRGKTTPVRSFPPNAFGLYDMHGNVWEWCEDDWHENYKGAPTDGSAWIETGKKAQKSSYSVLRGGSWNNNPVNCRSACRNNYSGRVNRNNNIGFRVLCVVGRTH